MIDSLHWILDDNGDPTPIDDLMTWAQWMEDHPAPRVDSTTMAGPDGLTEVSTVFLGLDHSRGSGPPLLFETMVFGGGDQWDQQCWRYTTRQEATDGHALVVRALTEGHGPAIVGGAS